MADYAEGPFERVVNVGWGAAENLMRVSEARFAVSASLVYRDCSDVNVTVPNLGPVTFFGLVPYAAVSPLAPGGFGSGELVLVPHPDFQSKPGSGDAMTISWSGYPCTFPDSGPQPRQSPVSGSVSGNVGPTSVSASIFLFGGVLFTPTLPVLSLVFIGNVAPPLTSQLFSLSLG